MKLLIAILTIVVTGCSTVPQRPENPQCVTMANYARTIATLRDMGVKEYEVPNFSSVPVVLTFPYRLVSEEVYNTQGNTPADIFVIFYNKCDQVGYTNILPVLIEDQRKRNEAQRKAKEEKVIVKVEHQKAVDEVLTTFSSYYPPNPYLQNKE